MFPVLPIAIIVLLVLRKRQGGLSLSFIGQFMLKLLIGLGVLVVYPLSPLLLKPLLLAGLLALWLPALTLEWVILPLRMPGLAYWFALVNWPLGMDREQQAGAVWYAARAVALGGNIDRLPGLRRQLARQPELGEFGQAAAATLAALSGDHRQARCLFLAVESRASSTPASRARAYARDWLLVDAARQGNWREMEWLDRRGHHRLPWSALLLALAERRGAACHRRPAAAAPSNRRLYWLWLLAPRRRLMWPLLQQTLQQPPAPPRTTAPAPGRPDLPAAWAAFAAVLAQPPATPTRLLRAVHHLECALRAPATTATIQRRAQQLAAAQISAPHTLHQVRAQISQMLEPLITAAPWLVAGKTRRAIIAPAVERVQDRLWQEIAAGSRDYAKRQEQPPLSALAEWETWTVFQDAVHRLLALAPALTDAVFEQMFAPVCNFAVEQHNTHKRYALAQDMFALLLHYAGSNHEARTLLRKNLGVSAG